jgi:hypothetical protein
MTRSSPSSLGRLQNKIQNGKDYDDGEPLGLRWFVGMSGWKLFAQTIRLPFFCSCSASIRPCTETSAGPRHDEDEEKEWKRRTARILLDVASFSRMARRSSTFFLRSGARA